MDPEASLDPDASLDAAELASLDGAAELDSAGAELDAAGAAVLLVVALSLLPHALMIRAAVAASATRPAFLRFEDVDILSCLLRALRGFV